MYTFEHTVFINRPPQVVFDFVTNPANSPKWQSGSVSAEWTSDGPVGVGSTWRGVSKLLGRTIESITEITTWDPPNEHSYKLRSGPIPFENTTKFEAKENGTLMTMNAQAEIGGFFKLAEGLAGKQLEKQIESNFSDLKMLLEA